jgi:hypothetical protein
VSEDVERDSSTKRVNIPATRIRKWQMFKRLISANPGAIINNFPNAVGVMFRLKRQFGKT